ncbi:efflux RND transporter permease subunit [Nitrosococcus watsonii]|uniref:Acriflavin resistance protein n=1 Tax=Nitrosococcus watsoni (strain C-113) TaxID=105559 RepID=D8KC04_NITWC|nr:efflux RND transporter permease subunit [Nitrosococcus watsonii]ADJ29675.1 acriflavin resistance protein [Nitrosococcus watsonii C-113]
MGLFVRHRVAANLLMVIMILSGTWALSQLNRQFFPNFALDIITVSVVWRGASAEDVARSITERLEEELRALDDLKKLDSTSAYGLATLTLEYYEGTDMGIALDKVKERIGQIRELPLDSETPEIRLVSRYENIARVLVTGPENPQELRRLVHKFERDLLNRGIAKVDIVGLPQQEIAIQIPVGNLRELEMSLGQVANRVADISRDLPAGTIGRNDVARQLRSLDQRRDSRAFADIPLTAQSDGRLIRLGDVATIERRDRDGETRLLYQGKPAVELQLKRTESGDSLQGAEILTQWLQAVRPTLPEGIKLHLFDQSWELVKERIGLLLKNGGGGLVLVVGILFLFLSGRVAIWVAIGIPVSFLATLAVLWAANGSINMISLFALIMALGIIVDDAIVVGEDALAQHQQGLSPLAAAEGGARRMLLPVLASSLTTVAAFLPLMLIGDVTGNILFDIPLVVICVILASLVESFLVLPGHLRYSFEKMKIGREGKIRLWLNQAFDRFRERVFRSLAVFAIQNRWITVSATLGLLVVVLGLLLGGRINFTFFPSPEGKVIYANASFAPGTPPRRVAAFIMELERTLYDTEAAFKQDLIAASIVKLGSATTAGGRAARNGDRFGSITVEFVSPDRREVRNQAFMQAWQERIKLPPGIESFTLSERQMGPPGQDLDIVLVGENERALKGAAVELAEALRKIPGVSAVEDDLPYGQEQLIYRLTPEGQSLELTVEAVGRQLRAAYEGRLVQIFQDGGDEIEVRVLLPDHERYRLASLTHLAIQLPNGGIAPLDTVVDLESRRGFDVLRHTQGRLAVHVSGDVDRGVNNSNRILAGLEHSFLPELRARYGIQTLFEGRAEEQRDTLGDMQHGLLLALAMIYLILTGVFSSYGWPLVVMAAIPFGLIGAILGHYVMGIDLTILSLFGFFGLSGIVVNDSIILVTFYKQLREQGQPYDTALIEAACQRLRAVLLTSLTTIAGLTPLLFEHSFQAQFLIPMAVSISFGLMFSTVLVLLVIPALLSIYERTLLWFKPPPEEDIAPELEAGEGATQAPVHHISGIPK